MDLQSIVLGIVGVVVSLAFSYFPKLKDWYEAQAQKGPIMLGVLLVVSLAYFGLGCVPSLADALHIVVACTVAGALELVKIFVAVAVGNQLAYLFAPKS